MKILFPYEYIEVHSAPKAVNKSANQGFFIPFLSKNALERFLKRMSKSIPNPPINLLDLSHRAESDSRNLLAVGSQFLLPKNA